jgi:hypothetical protein
MLALYHLLDDDPCDDAFVEAQQRAANALFLLEPRRKRRYFCIEIKCLAEPEQEDEAKEEAPKEEAPKKVAPKRAKRRRKLRVAPGKMQRYRGPLVVGGATRPSSWHIDDVNAFFSHYLAKCNMNPCTVRNYEKGVEWCKRTFPTQDTCEWYLRRDEFVSRIRVERNDSNVTKSSFKKLLDALALMDPVLFPSVKLARAKKPRAKKTLSIKKTGL